MLTQTKSLKNKSSKKLYNMHLRVFALSMKCLRVCLRKFIQAFLGKGNTKEK